jgi:hypothetical protein
LPSLVGRGLSRTATTSLLPQHKANTLELVLVLVLVLVARAALFTIILGVPAGSYQQHQEQ